MYDKKLDAAVVWELFVIFMLCGVVCYPWMFMHLHLYHAIVIVGAERDSEVEGGGGKKGKRTHCIGRATALS